MGSYQLFQWSKWRVRCVETSCAGKQKEFSSKACAMPYQHEKFTVYNVSVWAWNILCSYNDNTKMHICEMCNGFPQLSAFWGVFRLYKWAYCLLVFMSGVGDRRWTHFCGKELLRDIKQDGRIVCLKKRHVGMWTGWDWQGEVEEIFLFERNGQKSGVRFVLFRMSTNASSTMNHHIFL